MNQGSHGIHTWEETGKIVSALRSQLAGGLIVHALNAQLSAELEGGFVKSNLFKMARWDEQTTGFTGDANFDGNRWNDCHYTMKLKRAARAARKGVKKA